MGISFTISVSGKPIENEYPIDVFVRAKRDFITWRQKVKDSDVQLAYLETEPMVSHLAVEVADHLQELRNSNTETIRSTTATTLVSESPNLIFTTVVRDTNFGSTPAFYSHRVPVNATKVTFSPWNKAIDSSVAMFDTYYSAVFSDLENYIDLDTGAYNASYVKYTSVNSEGDVEVKTEVYNRQPFFRQMTSFDLEFDSSLGDFFVAPNKGLYQKTLQPNGKWLYQIYKDPDVVLYYKEDMESTGKVTVSENIKSEYFWPLEIKGSGVIYSVDIGDDAEKQKYTYDWADERVDYFPYAPYVTIKKEAYIINNQTLLVADKNIVLDPTLNIHLTLRVMRDGKILFAQTTRPEILDLRISGSYSNEDIVKYEAFTGNVDYSLGVISLVSSYPLMMTDKVLIEYVVEQARSEKVIANVNPGQNKKLLTSNLLYYATPVVGEVKSKIFWVSYQKAFNTITNDFDFFVVDTNDSVVNPYKGKLLKVLIEECFARDPYYDFHSTNIYNYLPVATVSFDKHRYLKKVQHKDLRVFSGLKDDLTLERKGKDFAFSNILNPAGTYELDLAAQAVVFVDKTEIAERTIKDIETIIKDNIKIGIIPHVVYLNRPKVMFAKCQNISNNLDFSVKVKDAPVWKTLKVYLAVNKEKISTNDIELLALDTADNLITEGEDGWSILGNGIDPDVLSGSAVRDSKLYFYTKWVNSDSTVESDTSSISCVHVK
jgi:hypothetical protein